MVLRGIGAVVTLLLINFALGWAWDSASGGESEPAPSRPGAVNLGGPAPQPSVVAAAGSEVIQAERDPRASSDQMKRYPWAEDYFRDFAGAPVSYWPSTVVRNEDYSSRYVNQRNGDRASYEARPQDEDLPTIAFCGGSTMWGEGQRDEFTIASYVARLAEADGLPVRVVNHGIRGVSSWDEALLFETDLSEGERPEVAVFYDGFNDCSLQQETPQPGQPWQFLVDGVRGRLGERPPEAPKGWTREALGQIWPRYANHSFVHKVFGKLGDALGSAPAGAAATVASVDAAEAGRNCAAVYRRARSTILSLSSDAGVTTRFFWQPVKDRDSSYRAFKAADPLVGAPTIDITHVLDDVEDEVYIDGGHTNEAGALAVAEAIYRNLRPLISARHAAGG